MSNYEVGLKSSTKVGLESNYEVGLESNYEIDESITMMMNMCGIIASNRACRTTRYTRKKAYRLPPKNVYWMQPGRLFTAE